MQTMPWRHLLCPVEVDVSVAADYSSMSVKQAI